MQLNAAKSVFMKITNKKLVHSFPYTLPSHPLVEVTEYKYLGVTITNNLSWNSHIANTCSSSYRKLGLLRHKLKNVPAKVKQLAYYSLIRPKLEYACTVWDPYTKKNIVALEAIQRKAVRFMFSKYRTSDSPSILMNENSIPQLQIRRKIQRLKYLFLLKNNKLAMSPEPYLTPLTTRPTRHHHAQSVTPYQAKINAFKYSFFPRTVEEWNKLPSDVTMSIESIDKLLAF